MPVEVALDDRLTKMQLRVLIALLSFRAKNTDTVWPKRAQLSARCGYNERTISKVTSQLVKLGWLEKEGQGGYSQSSKYRITVPELDTVDSEETVSELDTVTEPETVSTLDTVSTPETVSEPGTPTVSELGTPTVSGLDRGNKHTIEQTSEQFCAFWNAYPRKRDKARAQKSWNKLTDEQRKCAIDDVRKRSKRDPSWLEDNGKFIPHPSSYLNGQRWEDEWTDEPTDQQPRHRSMRSS